METTQGHKMNQTLTAPMDVTKWAGFIVDSREAGYTDDAIKVAMKDTMFRVSAITDAFLLVDDSEHAAAVAEQERIEAIDEECANREIELKAEKLADADNKTWNTRPTATKIRRKITADDASVYGSQYLGREGQTAWMSR